MGRNTQSKDRRDLFHNLDGVGEPERHAAELAILPTNMKCGTKRNAGQALSGDPRGGGPADRRAIKLDSSVPVSGQPAECHRICNRPLDVTTVMTGHGRRTRSTTTATSVGTAYRADRHRAGRSVVRGQAGKWPVPAHLVNRRCRPSSLSRFVKMAVQV
jgi:hypothetical protein